MPRMNVSNIGRAASIIAGAALVYYGQRSRDTVNSAATTAGLALIGRGLAGWCPVVAAADGNAGARQPLGPNFGLS
jgi:hypothetical protein